MLVSELKNNYTFNNVVCKFCRLFTSQIYKYHVIKNMRDYDLMDPCESVCVCVHAPPPKQENLKWQLGKKKIAKIKNTTIEGSWKNWKH